MSKPKVLIIMPAYNAGKTLKATYEHLPKNCFDEVVIVDDASTDATTQIAKSLGLPTITHKENKGYGGNLKTCLNYALQHKADITIELHPDNQYDASKIPLLIKKIRDDNCDLVLGSRFTNSEGPAEYGMHWYRILANKFLSSIDRMVLGIKLTEFHTGFRAYSLQLLKNIPYKANRDNYTFSFEVIVQAIALGFKVDEIPVVSTYTKNSTSASLFNSTIYALETFDVLRKYLLHKHFGSNFANFVS